MNDVFLTFDKVTIEDVNIKHLNKASSVLGSNHNNSAKKDLKDTMKGLDNVDKWIEALSALSTSGNEYATKTYKLDDWDIRKELAKAAGIEDRDLLLTIGAATYYAEPGKKIFTVDELILACNAYAESLEKRIITYQSQLEKKLSDDEWSVHLTFSKYCYIDVVGPAAKKVYETLLDKADHTFAFTLEPNDVKDADSLYHLTLKAIAADEL